MKTKELNERELQRVCGGAWARGEDGVGMKHVGHRRHIRRNTKPLFDAGGIVPVEPPPEQPTWKLLARIR